MPKDLVLSGISIVLSSVGLWGVLDPKSFSRAFHDPDDESDLLSANPSPRLQVGIRIAGAVLIVCGVCLGVASWVGINNPPDFDPNVF